MKRTALLLTLSSLAILSAAERTYPRVDDKAVQAASELLGDAPVRWGRPATDRAAWTGLAGHSFFRAVIQTAKREAPEGVPEVTREMWDAFRTTGSRTPFERPFFRRLSRANAFALAECLEGNGKWIPLLEKEISAILDAPTWTANASVKGDARVWDGEKIFVDLSGATHAWNLATIDGWLGDALSAPLRARIRSEIRRRIWDPYLAQVRRKEKPDWFWLEVGMNWNAVCHAGVVGSALLLLPDRKERAFFLASAKEFLKDYLDGFGADGYTSEGMGYFDFGFGHFAGFSELVLVATEGRLNLLSDPRTAAIASYPSRLHLGKGRWPAFADQEVDRQPKAEIQRLISLRLGLPWKDEGEIPLDIAGGQGEWLYLLNAFLFTDFPRPASGRTSTSAPLRDWFPDGKVWIARNGDPSVPFAIAVKAGSNDGPHHHHDNGSFVLLSGDQLPLVDPGMDSYTKDTFHKTKRWESQLINSWGHSVPVVAGAVQSEGGNAMAKVVAIRSNEAGDEISLDLTSSYAVPSLKSLLRTVRLERSPSPRVTVEDRVEFTSPQSFGTALISRQKPQPDGDSAWFFGGSGGAVHARFETDGREITFALDDKLKTFGAVSPQRLGIEFAKPVQKAVLRTILTPASWPETTRPAPRASRSDAGKGALSIVGAEASTDDGNGAANAIDGDPKTRWAAKGRGHSLTLELAASATVEGIGIATEKGNQRSARFEVSVSPDGGNYRKVDAFSTSGKSADSETFSFPAEADVRFVRITGQGNSLNDWNAYTEVRVLGTGVLAGSKDGPEAAEGTIGKLALAGAEASADDGNGAANAIDGSLKTRWAAKGRGHTLTLELKTPANANLLLLAADKGNQRSSRFEVLTSVDGAEYVPCGSFSTSGKSLELERFPLETKGAVRFVRIVGNGNSLNDWNAFTEVELHHEAR